MLLTNTNGLTDQKKQQGNAALEAVCFVPFLVFFLVLATNVAKAGIMKNNTHAACRYVAWHGVKPTVISSAPDAGQISRLFFRGEGVRLEHVDAASGDSIEQADGVAARQGQVFGGTVSEGQVHDSAGEGREARDKMNQSRGATGIFGGMLGNFFASATNERDQRVSYDFVPFLWNRQPLNRRGAFLPGAVVQQATITSHLYVGTNDYSLKEIGDWGTMLVSGLKSKLSEVF